jgi:hypothetical protein
LAGVPFCEILRELPSKGGLGPSKRGQKRGKKGFPPNVRYQRSLPSFPSLSVRKIPRKYQPIPYRNTELGYNSTKDHYPVPKGTKTDTNNEALMLMQNQRRHQRTIPYHPLTNTSSFCTAPASCTYCTFVALFKAAEAQYHQWEHVLHIPGQPHHNKEFTAKENVHTGILKKHLWPWREPQTMPSQYKQATFCQKRKTRRRSRQQG